MATTDEQRPPVLDHLDRAVMRATDGKSASRAKQIRWVGGELRRALEHEDFPEAGRDSLAKLLSFEPVAVYLELAAAGMLRLQGAVDEASVAASTRVRLGVLDLLGRTEGIRAQLPLRPEAPKRNTPLDTAEWSLLRSWVQYQADRSSGTEPLRVRAHAVIGAVLDTGARQGELCALTLDDLADDLTTVTVVRRPQSRRTAPLLRETYALSDSTRAAMRAWLRVREDLVAGLEGTTNALWVTTRHGVQGQEAAARPAGTPLTSSGLARAYAAVVADLNADMASEPGWEPLPPRMEQLRRAVSPAPRKVVAVVEGAEMLPDLPDEE